MERWFNKDYLNTVKVLNFSYKKVTVLLITQQLANSKAAKISMVSVSLFSSNHDSRNQESCWLSMADRFKGNSQRLQIKTKIRKSRS